LLNCADSEIGKAMSRTSADRIKIRLESFMVLLRDQSDKLQFVVLCMKMPASWRQTEVCRTSTEIAGNRKLRAWLFIIHLLMTPVS
jgi:hypothetical protein